MTAWGALLGLAAGTGLALIVVALPVGRRVGLEERVGPYVSVTRPTVSWSPSALRSEVARRLGELLGGDASVRRRLARAGSDQSVEQVRLEQAVWAATAFLGCLVLVALRAATAGIAVVPALLLCCCAAVAGGALRDQLLTRAAQRRDERIVAEFPTVAELLALAVSAGEGAAGALQRVARASSGDLSRELVRVLDDTRTGVGLAAALEAMARRLELAPVTRFVNGVTTALDRGTPLADVLRAQAADARDADRRRLMESAGRREIAMLVPVVFLVLPTTVVFALFPGFYGLDLAA